MGRGLLVGGDQWVPGNRHRAPTGDSREAISYGVGVVESSNRWLRLWEGVRAFVREGEPPQLRCRSCLAWMVIMVREEVVRHWIFNVILVG